MTDKYSSNYDSKWAGRNMEFMKAYCPKCDAEIKLPAPEHCPNCGEWTTLVFK